MQSAVVRQYAPSGLSKHVPPVHLPDRHCVPELQDVPGHWAWHTPPMQLPLTQSPDPVQPEPPWGIRHTPPEHTSPVAQFALLVHVDPTGHSTVHGPLAAAAGAIADCSTGVLHTAAPTTAPRRSRARRLSPCASAGAVAGRPGSGEAPVPEVEVR